MNVLLQHTKLAIRMHNNCINMDFIKKFSINHIMNCCDRIENSGIQTSLYDNNRMIQEELIRDEKFIKYLNIAYKRNYNMDNFETMLEEIINHNKKMSDYPLKDIFRTLDNKELSYKAYYDFLSYYINESLYTRKIVTRNLNYFYNQDDITCEELTEKERNLLKSHYLDNCNLIPKYYIKEIYEFLIKNEELRNIIDFFNSEKLFLPLTIKHYEEINRNAKQIAYYIKQITKTINNNEITYSMLLKWLNNNCSIYDLKVILEKISKIDISKMETIFANKTSYINFIYGNKLKRFPLDNLYGAKEDIVIYAIREDKKSFLRLIEDNMDTFFTIPGNSILYNEDFYQKYINLNEITLKHLLRLKTMEDRHNSYISILKEQNYTFEEIATLYNVHQKYIKLYNGLLDLKVDERLLRIRQLIRKDLLDGITDDNDIIKLAEKIKEKPLYSWLEKDFNHIENIKANDVLQILIHYENVKRVIPEIKDSKELSYILRNNEKISKYDSLKNIKEALPNIDTYWIKLKKELQFSDEFLQKYSNNIQQFLLNNGAELAYTYYIDRNAEQKQSFKLIIKAQLMGEFKKLKYHKDDLKKEIDYELQKYQIQEWTEINSYINEGKYSIREYDDFYHTMILGVYPKTTCLSYKDGGYNACLLACFDSNKKILYAKINDKIVARAMVRLTKGMYGTGKQTSKSLSFIDVENGIQTNKLENEESLTLFLERPYISGISDTEQHNVKKLFIKLLKAKAKQMNALLVLSNYYNDEIDEQFIATNYCMYISKSKSSSQYLDSLSGQATISDEGQYKENTFLICKMPIEKEENITFDSIFVA